MLHRRMLKAQQEDQGGISPTTFIFVESLAKSAIFMGAALVIGSFVKKESLKVGLFLAVGGAITTAVVLTKLRPAT